MSSALVVDDELELKEIYGKFFKKLGYQDIVTSHDSLDAFVLCSQKKFDIISLDHSMPVLKGADFLKALRSRPGLNQFTPVLMISGYVPEFYEDLKSLENTYFFDKPIDFEKFSTYVKMISAKKAS